MADKKHQKPPIAPPPEKRIGPESASDAMLMLAEGYSLTATARHFNVQIKTVRDWRERPESQALLAKARAERAATFREAAEEVRKIYRAAAIKAAMRMVDLLDNKDHAKDAARDILDRIGVLRGEEVHISGNIDHTKLGVEELRVLDEMRKKAAK